MSNPPVNYYKVLGLDPEAEPEVIRAAYRELAAKYHPDRGGDSERMRLINEAYAQLSDPDRRSEYDRRRTALPVAHRPPERRAAKAPRRLSRAELIFNLIVGTALAATLGVLAAFLVPLDLIATAGIAWWLGGRLQPRHLAILLSGYELGIWLGTPFYWHSVGIAWLAGVTAAGLLPVLLPVVASMMVSNRNDRRTSKGILLFAAAAALLVIASLAMLGSKTPIPQPFFIRLVWGNLIMIGLGIAVARRPADPSPITRPEPSGAE